MSVIYVSAVCGNEQCEQYDQDGYAAVDTADLPDGWGWFDGEFGVCESCGKQADVSFSLEPGDLDDPDSWRDDRLSEW